MKKSLLLVRDKVVDHLVGVLIAIILASPFVLEIFTKAKPFTQLAVTFLSSRWSDLIVFAFVSISWLVRKEIIKRRINKQGIIRKPPKYYASYVRETKEREFAGVIWKILVGSNVQPSVTELSRESVFAWPFPRPYCPECDYELERKKTRWYCMPCRKNYQIPRELREYTWEKIRRNFERLIVQWGYNNFGIAEDDHKPLSVVLRQMKKKRVEG